MTEQEIPIVTAEKAVDALPSLLTRLVEQVSHLLEAKIALLRVELKEEINIYLRNTVTLIAGGVVALIGFALFNVALAFLISTLFNNFNMSQAARYAIGFTLTAAVYCTAGAIIIIKAKNRITKQPVVPRTATELERDKEWLRQTAK